jgi:CheY-like chemotaxis protein
VVWAAYVGPTAVEVAASFNPDVVLLDLEMPGIDGYQVCRHIRAKCPRMTLIAVTAHAQPEVHQRVMAEGFFCRLVKPADPERLRALLELLKANRRDKFFTSSTADTVK